MELSSKELSSDHRSVAGYGGYVSILSALFLFSGWVSIKLTPVWHCYWNSVIMLWWRMFDFIIGFANWTKLFTLTEHLLKY